MPVIHDTMGNDMVDDVGEHDPETFIRTWHAQLADWLAGRTRMQGEPKRVLHASSLATSLAPEFTLLSATGRKLTREQLLDGLASRHGSEGTSFSIGISELKCFEHGAVIPGSALIMVAFDEDHLVADELWSSRRCTGVVRSTAAGFQWCRVREAWLRPPPNEPS